MPKHTYTRIHARTTHLTVDCPGYHGAGISAGGAFASQFHVAHSQKLAGAAIFAGPPYFCAQANMEIALTSCMKEPALVSVPALLKETERAFGIGSIDDPKNLANDKVWIWTGTHDTVVKSGVVEKTKQYYANFVANGTQVKFYNTYPAEHAWITNSYGKKCDFLGDPYINNCSFDAVGDFLNHLYDGNIKPAGSYNEDNLLRFEQSQYIALGSPASISFGNAGYAYIPRQCSNGTYCRLVIALHGCNQDVGTIGTTFVVHNGLNEYAETNNLVILYPQAKKSNLIPYNPQGCFDWWGYSGLNYSARGGAQIRAVANMVDAITGEFK